MMILMNWLINCHHQQKKNASDLMPKAVQVKRRKNHQRKKAKDNSHRRLFKDLPPITHCVVLQIKAALRLQVRTENIEVPSDWQETVDPESGETYYFNKNTEEVSWVKRE